MDDTNTSQNVESLIIDGYDTRKTTVPLGRHLSQSANVEDQKNFYKLKIQGCIFYNYCFFLLIIHPWMSTGGNMACTSIILAIGERLSRQRRDNGGRTSLGKELRVTFDGGSENWNWTTFCLLAWLVQVFPRMECMYIAFLPSTPTFPSTRGSRHWRCTSLAESVLVSGSLSSPLGSSFREFWMHAQGAFGVRRMVGA